jgi:hypothetical protein
MNFSVIWSHAQTLSQAEKTASSSKSLIPHRALEIAMPYAIYCTILNKIIGGACPLGQKPGFLRMTNHQNLNFWLRNLLFGHIIFSFA